MQAAFKDVDAVKASLRHATDSQRRFAMAAALETHRFYDDAIHLLIPEALAPMTIEQGNSHKVRAQFAPRLDASSQLLLRGLWFATNCNSLVDGLRKPQPAKQP